MEVYISHELSSDGKTYIRNKMIEYNLHHFPADLRGKYEEMHLFAKNKEGQIFGGMVGEICWNWLEVQYLFVDEEHRRLGYGKELMTQAETIAREKNCDFIKLDTLSFQALDFYLKLGFEVFGTILNAGGHKHYYLKKDLS
ncbi:GNAT family N-acetyltransferase [Paenibacillus sp. RC67]|uniref:GNAT family N-acetyltransferase n=1 Tax=Paenibacillus sp. RC67 TaxID=3039392 RepID=UPI0024AE3ABA|nr:GNAT family N-acetyltransferase [Paenibacillus sp. RC67]